ncbi:MAG: hypothetical protein CM15mP115_15620 [Alphaproteobacteria bacterium]|nr:MAG: hypothetical protein CM15mP115_15620 [Alphaproteobacteria bacterium]
MRGGAHPIWSERKTPAGRKRGVLSPWGDLSNAPLGPGALDQRVRPRCAKLNSNIYIKGVKNIVGSPLLQEGGLRPFFGGPDPPFNSKHVSSVLRFREIWYRR